MPLDSAIQHLLKAKRISAPSQSYAKDNPTEWAKVKRYFEGGARPTGITTEMGLGLIEIEDVRRADVTPSPAPMLGVDRATMLATAGTILREDNSAVADPLPGLWGQLAAVDASRHVYKISGGDPGLKGNGITQGNTNYREITVVNGDSYLGETDERAQLGRNWWQSGENTGVQTAGTFKLAHEGDRFITFWSCRFPTSYSYTGRNFQQIIQWKQAQPYSDANCATRNVDGNGVTLEIQLQNNLLRLFSWWHQRWTTTVPTKNVWVRFAWDITFSQFNNIGKMQLFVDLDGDGDFLDAAEMSPVLTGANMLYVTTAHQGMSVGDSVPNVLMTGVYHFNDYGTTTMNLDNVQVIG